MYHIFSHDIGGRGISGGGVITSCGGRRGAGRPLASCVGACLGAVAGRGGGEGCGRGACCGAGSGRKSGRGGALQKMWSNWEILFKKMCAKLKT